MRLPSNYRVVVARIPILRFENGVVSNGSQTVAWAFKTVTLFENGVVSNGSQTFKTVLLYFLQFENGVVSNGSQT